MIVGTAGHIDHGKTTLVHALTGIDTDRLPEEKRRGITIELGFAPLALDGVGTVGVVDVPGHERVRQHMVAGATGIDLVVLVVAADEGVMPQTREHLRISACSACRRRRRDHQADLVDAEWLEMVTDDVRAATAAALSNAPVVAISAKTGQASTNCALSSPRRLSPCHRCAGRPVPAADRPRVHDPRHRNGGDRNGVVGESPATRPREFCRARAPLACAASRPTESNSTAAPPDRAPPSRSSASTLPTWRVARRS